MKEIRIIGILVTDRIKEAGRTQETLSRHANVIKSRLGFHEVTDAVCSRTGVIILQLSGSKEDIEQLELELKQIGGLEIQRMIFQI